MAPSISREYFRLRALGFAGSQALRDARTNVAFSEAEAAGLVRFRVVPDECNDPDDLAGDCTARQRDETIALANREGVWGIVTERLCPCCDQWKHADSVWGFIGDQYADSGYDADVKRSALDELHEGRAA